MNTYEKRNIAEQVEKNKQDILKHFQRDEILADFGIRIIGQLESPEELPESAANYGDAYAVGTKSPFDYYIWTRANNLSPVDYWFNFGEIAIAGPQGPRGDKGPKGDTGNSTTWISIFTLDYLDLDEQDIPLDTMVLEYGTGNVYQVQIVNGVKTFNYSLNIKGPQGAIGPKGPKGDTGPQGPQGPKGDTGDVGGFINIGGIVNSEYDLPDPEQVQNLTVAFLVGTAEPYELYIQVGSTSATAEWMNMGVLNVATYVSVGGQYQNTWDADTKLDKVSTASGFNQAYVKGYTGAQTMTDISQTPKNWSLPSYDGNGCLKTNTPEANTDCANKAYVDAKAGGGWQIIRYEGFTQDGQIALPTSLQGHHINLMAAVDYHRFSDWNERHTAMFGPTPWRLEGPELPALAITVNGITDDTELTNPKIQLSGDAYGNLSFNFANVNFRITTDGGMDLYNPEITFYYQDLGPSFVKYP